jgi:2-iminoacetate synthase ThiH
MRLIIYRQRVAAIACSRVYFTPHIDVLEADHPERRFVAALCLYSRAVDTGQVAFREYEHVRAERFARALLMPGDDFDAATRLPDVDLAERFVAPLDQVRLRRRERSRSRPAEGANDCPGSY